jgi:hypothetical protein
MPGKKWNAEVEMWNSELTGKENFGIYNSHFRIPKSSFNNTPSFQYSMTPTLFYLRLFLGNKRYDPHKNETREKYHGKCSF